VVDHNDNHHQYPNDQVGFKEFHKILTKKSKNPTSPGRVK